MGGQFLVVTTEGVVGDDLVGEVIARAGAGAGTPRRLGKGAVEIPLAAMIDDLAPLRQGLAADVNQVAADARRKAILIADMDSTIISVECIDELADYAGVKEHVARITEAAMRGELDFEQALFARVELLRGLPVSVLQSCYDERVRLNPGAAAMVGGMNAAGARTALVSGGFTFFTERVAAAAGFQSNQANVLEEADGRLTGSVRLPVLGRQAKADALDALCAERGVTPRDVVAIGDGANDLSMIEKAGLGVAYRAKPALREKADAVLDHSDLTAVLALQGLPLPS
ncbi:phosphoserine phosphatase SerB [Halovulum dunhuangense]|uniref:Phosphoserine phosphatase n=1 Tax=Halovulum dunhuangense TaxID=1505036 RepID=A0A849L2A4_9RHOB|nr:phosphoserine phosphatase SerB [Halovulum dunhuangense]NNU80468.1 phosphoserine phosphatase SerB [Halovulum dunhuangense]